MAWVEKYVRADAAGGGTGNSDTAGDAWTLAEAIANAAAGQRINVKAGVYASTTTTRTFANAGTTTAPIWWRGFKTTIGDMDAEPVSTRVAGTDIPQFTSTTGRFVVSGAHQIFSNMDIVGAPSAISLLGITAGLVRCDRVRAEHTSSASNSNHACAIATNNGVCMTRCWFKAAATGAFCVSMTAFAEFAGCVFQGGGNGINAGISLYAANSVFTGQASHGTVLAAGANALISNCTFYNSGGDGIRVSGVPSSVQLIVNCIFSGCSGYGINNSTGTNTNLVTRIGNLFHSCTSGNENGFGDAPSFYENSDASSPFVNSAAGDLSLASGSNARATAAPGLFENASYTHYGDRGAVQHQDSGGSGGGGIITPRGWNGGYNQ